jgi:hypothetical protein
MTRSKRRIHSSFPGTEAVRYQDILITTDGTSDTNDGTHSGIVKKVARLQGILLDNAAAWKPMHWKQHDIGFTQVGYEHVVGHSAFASIRKVPFVQHPYLAVAIVVKMLSLTVPMEPDQ